jgi:hypothetical protein
MPSEFLPEFGIQHLYSPDDVAMLVAKAIERRDEAWQHWIADSHERAIHPTGPAIVGSDEFFNDHLTGE